MATKMMAICFHISIPMSINLNLYFEWTNPGIYMFIFYN